MCFRFPVVREAEQQDTGNDFRFADGRVSLLEESFAEIVNASACIAPAAVVIAPIYWRRHGDHFVVASPA